MRCGGARRDLFPGKPCLAGQERVEPAGEAHATARGEAGARARSRAERPRLRAACPSRRGSALASPRRAVEIVGREEALGEIPALCAHTIRWGRRSRRGARRLGRRVGALCRPGREMAASCASSGQSAAVTSARISSSSRPGRPQPTPALADEPAPLSERTAARPLSASRHNAQPRAPTPAREARERGQHPRRNPAQPSTRGTSPRSRRSCSSCRSDSRTRPPGDGDAAPSRPIARRTRGTLVLSRRAARSRNSVHFVI